MRALAVVLLLAACGGGHSDATDNTDAGSGSLSITDYYTQSRNAGCTFVVNCCEPVTGMTYYASVSACESALPIAANVTTLNAAIAAGGVTYDAAAAAQCIAAQMAWAAACAPSITQTEATTLSCYNVLAGNVTMGGACNTTSLFCKTGLFCSTTTSTCQPAAATNAVCSSCDNSGNCTMATCAAGNFCQTGGNPNDVCVAQATNGEVCTASAQCTSGYCDSIQGLCANHPDYTISDLCTQQTGTKM